MRPSILILLLQVLAFFFANAQPIKRGDIWYFGVKAGLNFKTDPPTVLYDGQVNDLLARSCTISDESGNLLFYTDGQNVWNKHHQVMPNGSGLSPDPDYLDMPSVIVPDPRDSKLYYIFTSDQLDGPSPSGLHYAVVDISGDGGNGIVVQKRVQLVSPATLLLSSVNDADNESYWIIAHKLDTIKFYAYHIDETGISPPVISAIGSIYSERGENFDPTQMSVSPDGTMLAVATGGTVNGKIELFDFNSKLGSITNLRTLTLPEDQFMGVSFSPNSLLLYGSTADNSIYQFDVSKSNENEINASGIRVGEVSRNILTDLQLASNGELYCGRGGGDCCSPLIAIHKPDVIGTGCRFDGNALRIPNDDPICLPTSVQSFYRTPTTLVKAATCEGDPAQISVSSIGYADSVLWDYGDNVKESFLSPVPRAVKHIYQDSGVYMVTMTKYIGTIPLTVQDTFNIKFKPFVNLGADTTLCKGQQLKLSADSAASIIKWSTGQSTNTINVKNSGIYAVLVASDFCNSTDTVTVNFIDYPTIKLPDKIVKCTPQDTLTIPKNTAYNYKWSTGQITNSIIVRASGLYEVEVSNKQCMTKDSVVLQFENITDFKMEQSEYIVDDTLQSPISLNAFGVNVEQWHWSFGDGSQTLTSIPETDHHYLSGEYQGSVIGTNQWSCKAEATFSVKVPFLEIIPNVFTPNGDGKNEVFEIIYNGDVSNYFLAIYNRYGKEVFTTTDPSNYWTASEQPSGIYYFSVQLGNKARKGWVQVVK